MPAVQSWGPCVGHESWLYGSQWWASFQIWTIFLLCTTLAICQMHTIYCGNGHSSRQSHRHISEILEDHGTMTSQANIKTCNLQQNVFLSDPSSCKHCPCFHWNTSNLFSRFPGSWTEVTDVTENEATFAPKNLALDIAGAVPLSGLTAYTVRPSDCFHRKWANYKSKWSRVTVRCSCLLKD